MRRPRKRTVLILAALLLLVGCQAGPESEETAARLWVNELPGYEFRDSPDWPPVLPGETSIDGARRVMGEPEEALDLLVDPALPYQGDATADRVVLCYPFREGWELNLFFEREPGSQPGSRDLVLSTIRLTPLEWVSFEDIEFPPVFRKTHVTAGGGAAWNEYSDDSGLTYRVYTVPGEFDRDPPGGLYCIEYELPGD